MQSQQQMQQSQQQFTEQSQQQAQQELQKAMQRLQQASDPTERARWAQEVRYQAERITSYSGTSSSSTRERSVLTVEAFLPSEQASQQLSQQLSIHTTPGIKEVAFRRENGIPKVRIQATQEVLPQIHEVLQQVARTVTQAYAGQSSS